jgi:hypothetical protein
MPDGGLQWHCAAIYPEWTLHLLVSEVPEVSGASGFWFFRPAVGLHLTAGGIWWSIGEAISQILL